VDKTPSIGLSYPDLVKEIEEVKGLLNRYYKEDPSLPVDFNYRKVIARLQHLRNKQKSVKKVEKNKYEQEKE
jgi:hypothetical protein